MNKNDSLLCSYLQVYDNDDLPDGAWQAMIEDGVDAFNEDYGTVYDRNEGFLIYCRKHALDSPEKP